MGIIKTFSDMLRTRTAGQVAGTVDGADVTLTAFMTGDASIENYSVAKMWKSQPHLRTVVDFMAKQVGQVGLHPYKRDGETTERVYSGTLAERLRAPNPEDTLPELIYQLVGCLALYEDVSVLVLPHRDGGKQLRVIPGPLLQPVQKSRFEVDHYLLVGDDGSRKIKPEQVVRFKGWTPDDPTKGTSPVETLRLMLEEQHDARIYRKQVWKRAGRFGGVLERPKDAPEWDNNARSRFSKMWEAFTGTEGSRAGDTPILEDGMTYKRVGFAAKEDQWLESAKLSLETCAQVYGINPTMIGMLDNANYANVREFRRALFGDSLGWMIKRIESRFNAFLLPLLGAADGEFVEFNVEAKLRGSFEEQAAVLSTSVGGPWMTRNEARALFNRAPLDGGDAIITPLNVLVGGQASPQDGKAPADILVKFLERQREAVMAKRNSGVENWWDRDRWDRELADDLVKAGLHQEPASSLARVVNGYAAEAYLVGDTAGLERKALEAIA